LHVDGHDILPTASIGLALFPADGEFFEILLSSAESAMYQVKASGRNNYHFFTSGMQQKSSRFLMLSNAIKLAIANNELRLVFQPQMALIDASLVGAEALLRWQHPELGEVSPDEFIPLAESAGLMVQLGEWVLNKVASQLQQWRMSGHPVIKIAVNFASVMFARIETVDDLRAILHAYDLPPTLLELEMTESAAIQNPLETLQTMQQLTAMGLHLAIDDFGTGYSSLSYLRHLSVHKLKIDQSFMRELHTNKDGQAIVTAIIRMAHELGMKVLAEGVETSEQLEFLRAKGCDEIQGYFYSKPLELDDFADFLLRHRE
jgi:EAL domain-containing protein (putative c-di-GMP-specific phosphodiesterase class I)